MKHLLSLCLCASVFNLHSAVPLRWTVETSRVQPATFEAYQGETLDFEATLQSYGKPLAAPSEYAFYWQTNGMGSAWWVRPCRNGEAVSSPLHTNVLFATWTPDMDVGARVYTCFIGQTGTVYHAAFQLRLRPSPGATPNELPLPTPVIDFAKVTVLNPPWSGGSGVDPQEVLSLVEGAVGGTNAVKAAVAAVANKADSQKDGYKGSIGTVFLTPNGDRYGVDYAENANYAKEADDATFAYRAGAVEWQGIENKPDIPTKIDVLEAKAYARETYEYMTGNTNAWFAGTNYVVGADAETRHRFAWEDGMDAETVPCSMALWEIREGRKQVVWDQRDWTAWYWSFKSGQMRGEIAAAKAEVYAVVTNDETHAWAKHYAATGRRNPDASTTFIDTQSVTLSPGMAWETVATVGGCGYWTIVGNGAVIGGSGTNATLNIKDFEGNSILEITKGKHMLAWLDSSDFVGQMTDSDGWICFDMMADVKPTGYFSTTLVAADFVAETDANCPAQHRWESLGGGVWRVHFLLKPGIVARTCFAKFQVEVEGKTQIRYNADTVINGGLIFNGVKIAPVVTPGAAAGTSVEWKVVP